MCHNVSKLSQKRTDRTIQTPKNLVLIEQYRVLQNRELLEQNKKLQIRELVGKTEHYKLEHQCNKTENKQVCELIK